MATRLLKKALTSAACEKMGGGHSAATRKSFGGWPAANSLEQYLEVADLVEACFTRSDDGLWFTSQTLTEEWDSATTILDKRREAGAKGGASKREANAKAKPKQALAHPSSSSSSTVLNSLSSGESIAEALITKIRGIGAWRDAQAISAEHALVEQLAGGADPTALFTSLCRIHAWTEGGVYAPKLALTIPRWREPREMWARDKKQDKPKDAEVGKWDGTITATQECYRCRREFVSSEAVEGIFCSQECLKAKPGAFDVEKLAKAKGM